MQPSFVHLRAHTEYSITESTLRIKDLIEHAKKNGQPAVAMTDVDNMFGAINFYSDARSAGLKPIIGVDAQIQGRGKPIDPAVPDVLEFEAPHRVLLLCENYEGYLRLMRLISKGYNSNMLNGVPTLKEDWLREEGTQGLLCLSGDETSLVGRSVVAGDMAKAKEDAQRYAQEFFPDRYFLEVQRRGVAAEAAFVQGVVSLADEIQIPLVATHPMQFIERDDYIGHEIKVCDKTKTGLYDRVRERRFTPEQYFQTNAQMQELFSDIPDALSNTVALAQRCSLDIPLNKNVLPPFPTPDGSSLSEHFTNEAQKGLEQRMLKLYPNAQQRQEKMPEYQKRLDHEVQTIIKMGFDGYFMIVADFIGWSKEHQIPVGPGRGSGAGSLVAYSLKITDLDPLKYDLLFERFLNPERVSMPDFDIDFCQARRELVIDYVTQKYGVQAVAGIANINRLGAKAAVKAAGRALRIPQPAVERVSKLIPTRPGQDINLTDTIKNEPDFAELYESDPQVTKLVNAALRIEGLPHAIGQHAGGVVMAPTRIADFSPQYMPEGKLQAVTQYDKDAIEKAGLVKFDFLGLKTLTEVDLAVRIIHEALGKPDFELDSIPLTDTKTLESFQRGDTISVFQFESGGMQRMLKDVHPDRFEDLVALNALYRPGPMDLIPSFQNRKHGREPVNYPDERLRPILGETYGVMVYQEQVMQIAQVIGGYTLGAADLLRRAMGKKKAEEMAQHRTIFVTGAAKNGIDADKATKLFDMMEKFAGYGFNKSHAAAYSLLAFQTGYLKQHYPNAFYSAWMTVEGNEDTASIPPLLSDAKNHGLIVLGPDVNRSHINFYPDSEDPSKLRYGLTGLKGLGTEAAAKIEQERKTNGPFTSLLNFCQRLEKGTVNRKGVEVLIKSGAFDSLHPNRAEALAFLPLANKYMDDLLKSEEKALKAKASAAADLLAAAPTKKPRKTKEKAPILEPEWPQLPQQDLLAKCSGEKDAFGFYFEGNPFAYYKEQLGGLAGCLSLSEVQQLQPGFNQHWVAGIITEIKSFNTSRGKMGIIKITDGDDTIEVKAFSDVFAENAKILKPDQFVLFAAQAKEDKISGVAMIAQEVKDVPAIKTLLADNLNVALPLDRLARLDQMAANNPGDFPLTVWHPHESSYVRSQSAAFKVGLTDKFIDELSQEFGDKYVKLRFKKSLPMPSGGGKKPFYGRKSTPNR